MRAIKLVAIFAVAFVVVIVTTRHRQPRLMNYGDMRQQAFAAADQIRPRGQPPTRPANLDTRLPAATAAQLRSLYPPTKENHDAFFDCYYAIVQSITSELEAIDKDVSWYELLSPGRRAVILVEELEGEVNNGGFDQYYLNSSGDGAPLAPAALRLLAQEAPAKLVERANAQFQAGPPADRAQRLKAMDTLGENARQAWDQLDSEFYKLKTDNGVAIDAAVPYILSHEAEFFRTK